jgi:hypothetical protein
MRWQLENFMLGRAGQEIIRDFAGNLENVNYYQTNDGRVFRTKGGFLKKGNEIHNSRLMQCNDEKYMSDKIASTCPSMKAEERRRRINHIMNGLNYSSDMDLEKHIERHSQAILVTTTADNKLFKRDRYDEVRRSVSNSEEVKFIDHIMAKFLVNTSKDQLQKIAENSEGDLPEAFLTKTLASEYAQNPEDFLQKYAPKGDRFKDYVKFLKDSSGDLESIKKVFSDQIIKAGLHNPAFKLAMTDKDFLFKVDDAVNKRTSSIIEKIEGSDLLPEAFEKSCQAIVSKLASTVCLPQSEILRNIDANKVREMLPINAHGLTHPEVIEALLCESHRTNEGDANQLFKMFRNTRGHPLLNPDYTQKTSPFHEAAKMAEEEIVALAGLSSSSRRGMDEVNRASSIAARGMSATEEFAAALLGPGATSDKVLKDTDISKILDRNPASIATTNDLSHHSGQLHSFI